jgi:hypothetical protein
VYAERHRIDIDLWLYEIDAAGELGQVLESGVGYDTEESIFMILDGSPSSPREYLLRFQ